MKKTPLEIYTEELIEQAEKRKNKKCDHKLRTPDGAVYGYRNICEICGTNLKL